MNRRDNAFRVLADNIGPWFRAGPDTPRRGRAICRALQVLEPVEVASVLRQVRKSYFWYEEAFGPIHGVAGWRETLLASRDMTKVEDQSWALFGVLCHPNGFARQGIVEILTGGSSAEVLALCFAADDHVPQVRSLAAAKLSRVPPAVLACAASVVEQVTHGQHRAAWRHEVQERLGAPEGLEALAGLAVGREGRTADSAWSLLVELGHGLRPGDALKARSWRVRRLAALAAVQDEDVEVAKCFLKDRLTAVRYATAWAAAFLSSPMREEILSEALEDRSVRVLRIAIAYLASNEVAIRRANELLVSPGVRERLAGVRLAPLFYENSARTALRAAQSDESPAVRAWSFRVLAEQGWLGPEDVGSLVEEVDPQVFSFLGGQVFASQKGRDALMPLFESKAFIESIGPARFLSKMSVWDGMPMVLRALAEGWPAADQIQERAQNRLSRQNVRGWLVPNTVQAARVEAVLTKFEDSYSESVEALVSELRSVLKVVQERDSFRS